MITVPLRDDLANQLKSEATRRHTTVEALANEWLEEQLWEAKRAKINEEAEHFRAQHAELFTQYAGQHIAMRDGVVIDHAPDLVVLNDRIRKQYGDEPILIAPVNSELIQTIRIVSARQRGEQQ